MALPCISGLSLAHCVDQAGLRLTEGHLAMLMFKEPPYEWIHVLVAFCSGYEIV